VNLCRIQAIRPSAGGALSAFEQPEPLGHRTAHTSRTSSMIRTVIRSLWNSPALRIAAAYSVAGAAFAGSMLLLARALPKAEFGLLGLVVTILNVASRTAPLGADGIVNRRRMDPGPRLLGRVLATASVFGAGVTMLSWWVYELEAPFLILIFAGTVAGAASFVASSQFQAHEKFGISVLLNQGMNFVLLGAAGLALVLGLKTAFVPAAFFVGGFFLAAALGWAALFRSRGPDPDPGESFHWGEALSYWGVAGGAEFLHQLDRLMVPELLSFEALATFSVLAAIVGAPFHMLQLAVGYTLLPRLRREPTVLGRRILIRREGLVTGFAAMGAGALLLVVTPWVVQLFVGDKYVLPTGLIVAGLILRLNIFSWFSIALAAGGAAVGARWGLQGLLYGIGVGWVGHSVAGFALGAKHLRKTSNHVEA